MNTITLSYNARNENAVKTLNYILSLGFFKTKETVKEEYPYNRKFVKKLQESRNGEGKKIKTADLWK